MKLPDKFYFVTRISKKPIYVACLNDDDRYEVWVHPKQPHTDHGVHHRASMADAVKRGHLKMLNLNTNEGASLLLEENDLP
jgi:hypothetical protein